MMMSKPLARGWEHEDLVVWYLEQKEEEINTEQEMKDERTLVEKVLRRMVKVNIYPSYIEDKCKANDGIRTTSSCKYEEKALSMGMKALRVAQGTRTRLSTCCIPIALWRRCRHDAF